MTTIVGLFDDIRDAQLAFDDLITNGFRRDTLNLVFNAEAQPLPPEFKPTTVAGGDTGTFAPHRYTVAGIGRAFAIGPITALLGSLARDSLLRSLVELNLHEADARIYAEAVRRGGALLITTTEDEQVTQVDAVLREHNRADIEERVRHWRERGWTGFDENASPLSPIELARERELDLPRLTEQPGDTYPKEGAGGGVWSGKTPHTSDEKAIEEHARAEWMETIQPRSVGPEAGPPATGEGMYDADFRNHFDAMYVGMALYAEFEPAYRFGALMGRSADYAGRDWSDVENEMRGEWQQTHPGTWERYGDAIHYGWDRARGRAYVGPERRSKAREHTRR